MYLLRLFRFIIGYVIFTASGGFSERFLNLCSQQGIPITNVKMNERSVTAEIQASKYKKLRKIARLSGSTLRCTEKHGLYFWGKHREERVGLAVGTVFFVVFLSLVSLFVWNVECVGSQNLSEQTILEVAKNAGIYPGSLCRSINQVQAANTIITELNGKLSWVSVNLKGSHAVVEVRDYIARREDETYSAPCNIIADFDGVLLSVEVYNGTKANFEGGAVKKGDLLISGIAENRDTSSVFMEARGVITALHDDVFTTVGSLNSSVRTFYRNKTVKSIGLFGLKIPLGFFGQSGEYEEFTESTSLYFGDVRLPFYISKTTRAYYQDTPCAEEGKLSTLIFDDFTGEEYERYKNTTILTNKISFQPLPGELTVQSESRCIDFMGVKQEIRFADESQ